MHLFDGRGFSPCVFGRPASSVTNLGRLQPMAVTSATAVRWIWKENLPLILSTGRANSLLGRDENRDKHHDHHGVSYVMLTTV